MSTNMMSKKVLIQAAASLLLMFATMPVADAQTAPTEPAQAPARVNIFKQCAAQSNITLPAKGSGEQLSAANKETIRACVKTAKKAAWKQCAQASGFTPGQGQKPTVEEHQQIRECMVKAGFHRHHGRGQSQEQASPAT